MVLSVEQFKTCDLSLGVAAALKGLADEVKEGTDVTQTLANNIKGELSNQITSRKRKGNNIFNVAYGQPANSFIGNETDAPEPSISPKRYRVSLPSSSKLVVSGELKGFPLSKTDFSKIRQPGFAYFDKTEYITKLENGTDVQLVCRPSRFGKSLTVTMLRYFHGFQFCNQYDKLFKVCEVLSGQDLHARITYTKVRVSTWIRLSEMA